MAAIEKKVAQITLDDKTKKELKALTGYENSFLLFELFDRIDLDLGLLDNVNEKHDKELKVISKLKNDKIKKEKTKEIRTIMGKEIAFKIASIVMRKSYKAKDLIEELIMASFSMSKKEMESNRNPEFYTLSMMMIISKNYSAIVGFMASANS